MEKNLKVQYVFNIFIIFFTKVIFEKKNNNNMEWKVILVRIYFKILLGNLAGPREGANKI